MPKTAVVTVTYGNRWEFLRSLLRVLIPGDDISRIVVVDNGATYDLAARTAKFETGKIKILPMGRNLGSAAGFRAGIDAVVSEAAASYVWLLDDDNLPSPRTLKALLEVTGEAGGKTGCDNFALVSFRPEHQPDIASGVPLRRCYPRPGSFFGFHLADVPYKLWRRTRWGRPRVAERLPDLIPIPFSPYGGFFFPLGLISRIGLPMPELVLYADDTEFTSRVQLSGGGVFLVPRSELIDMERSWNLKSSFGSSLSQWLKGGSDLRAYYSARNQSYLETRISGGSRMRKTNRTLYLSLLGLLAFTTRRSRRLRLLREAIVAGEAGILGMDERFRLP